MQQTCCLRTHSDCHSCLVCITRIKLGHFFWYATCAARVDSPYCLGVPVCLSMHPRSSSCFVIICACAGEKATPPPPLLLYCRRLPTSNSPLAQTYL